MSLACLSVCFVGWLLNNVISREIQLAAQSDMSFKRWVIKLDDSQTFPFSDTGGLTLQVPQQSQSFEILDGDRQVRFFGTWSQFGKDEAIEIQVDKKAFQVHQVVSASRIEQSSWSVPAEISVVRPDEQPEYQTAQTSDLLKEQAEIVLQKTNLGGGSPIIRGMSGNRILLMMDGFRLNNAIFRLGLNQYLNTIPGDQLEQVEILNGPSGVQYGSDGLGGTVHLRTADPAGKEPSFGYQGSWSSGDQTNSHLLLGTVSKGSWHFGGHLSLHDYRNLDAGKPLGDQIPTGYDAWDGSLRLTYTFDENQRLRFINTYSDARHVPRTDRIISGRDLLWEYSPQVLRIHGIRYETSVPNLLADFMDVGIGFMKQDEGTRRIPSSNPNSLREERTSVDTAQVNGTFTKVWSRLQLTYGFDVQLDEVGSSELRTDLETELSTPRAGKFPNDSSFQSTGLFAVGTLELADGHALRTGVRQTWTSLEGTLAEPIGFVDQTNQQFTPSLTWSWEQPNWFVSLGASQGFRAPNLEDSLALGPANGGFDAPNPGLAAEELWSYELTARWRQPKFIWEASIYTSLYDELIDRVPGTYLGESTYDGEPVFILDNVGEARVQGLSTRLRTNFSERHNFETDVAWTRGTQTDLDVPMRRIPPLRGNLQWRTTWDQWKLVGAFSWAARQDRLSPGDSSDSRIPDDGTPGYGVFHLRSHYRFNESFSVNASLENLGDKLYKQHGSGIFEPGRRLLLELKANWR